MSLVRAGRACRTETPQRADRRRWPAPSAGGRPQGSACGGSKCTADPNASDTEQFRDQLAGQAEITAGGERVVLGPRRHCRAGRHRAPDVRRGPTLSSSSAAAATRTCACRVKPPRGGPRPESGWRNRTPARSRSRTKAGIIGWRRFPQRYRGTPKKSIRTGAIDLGRGVVIVSVEHHERTRPAWPAACSATERWNQPGLFLPPRMRTGAVIFLSSAVGTADVGDGECTYGSVGVKGVRGRLTHGAPSICASISQALERPRTSRKQRPRRRAGTTAGGSIRGSTGGGGVSSLRNGASYAAMPAAVQASAAARSAIAARVSGRTGTEARAPSPPGGGHVLVSSLPGGDGSLSRQSPGPGGRRRRR